MLHPVYWLQTGEMLDLDIFLLCRQNNTSLVEDILHQEWNADGWALELITLHIQGCVWMWWEKGTKHRNPKKKNQQYTCRRSYEITGECTETPCVCSRKFQTPSWNTQRFAGKGQFILFLWKCVFVHSESLPRIPDFDRYIWK